MSGIRRGELDPEEAAEVEALKLAIERRVEGLMGGGA